LRIFLIFCLTLFSLSALVNFLALALNFLSFLSTTLAATFLCSGAFLISANTLAYKASTDLEPVFFKHSSHLANYFL